MCVGNATFASYLFIVHLCVCCCLFCRAVGTFARALDCSSSVRQPSLHMSAAAASRDITLVSLETHVHPAALKSLFKSFNCYPLSLSLFLSVCPLLAVPRDGHTASP